jgi:hypothetical protein
MAAVWAAGPDPMTTQLLANNSSMSHDYLSQNSRSVHGCLPYKGAYSLMTLLCIFLLLSALLNRRLALSPGCNGLCCIVAAAAIDIPPERKVLLIAEENSLKVSKL